MHGTQGLPGGERILIPPDAALATALFASLAPPALAHEGHGNLKTVRDATERFRDVDVARNAGYEAVGGCVAGPDGGMGVHYASERLMRDPRVRIRRPEILVYRPVGKRLRLVAVEYYRTDADGRLDTDDDRPRLFGRGFDGPVEGHDPVGPCTTTCTPGSGSATRPGRSPSSTRA